MQYFFGIKEFGARRSAYMGVFLLKRRVILGKCFEYHSSIGFQPVQKSLVQFVSLRLMEMRINQYDGIKLVLLVFHGGSGENIVLNLNSPFFC